MTIQLKPYEEAHRSHLLIYTLPQEQMPFTALPQAVFERVAMRQSNGDFDAHIISILDDDMPVGMFVLDKGSDLNKWTENKHAFLLRSLSINPAFQNKGIAKHAMQLLSQFIKHHFSDLQIDEIVLGVNINNSLARCLYTNLGFVSYGYNMNHPFAGQEIMKWRFTNSEVNEIEE